MIEIFSEADCRKYLQRADLLNLQKGQLVFVQRPQRTKKPNKIYHKEVAGVLTIVQLREAGGIEPDMEIYDWDIPHKMQMWEPTPEEVMEFRLSI